MSENLINIEIAYAEPQQQWLLNLQVLANTTVTDAIKQANLLGLLPQTDFDLHNVGIFGRSCSLDTILKHNDRIEIYRALICDPKQARRNRAAKI